MPYTFSSCQLEACWPTAIVLNLPIHLLDMVKCAYVLYGYRGRSQPEKKLWVLKFNIPNLGQG